ncbi:MAG: hypothetical protein HOC91_17850 [Nitrospinaceae bacterium]|nr:hypothetical protein [Nitrospinaceae bacterium]MBT4094297.1 hypothetical protein [Nitrospinaceae bacterium]MBT4432377.1 hypothetical protein [Nitrospinaceae bacterium]MBT5367746.1 hypothetical protein [Nitrospinaceae bacterium]MBT5946128.1 hypothetical protein [Nitrospinaceae bacterium]
MLQGTFGEIAYRLVVSCVGIIFIVMAAMGYGRALLRTNDRIIMVAAAMFLFLPSPWLNVLGLLVGAWHMKIRQNASEGSAASSG